MSEQKIDPGVIKKTQDTLGRVIQAPALTEKLLNRPPVQFVQDIVKSVIKNTGFMKGLYKSDELEGAYIKESKENKLLFLTKLITVVGVVIGQQLSVKASKIAAGSEAEKTNDLFQNLAKAINMKPDNDEVVKKALKIIKSSESGEKEEKEEKPNREKREKDDEKESRRDREKERDKPKEKEKSRPDDSRERDREKTKEKESKDRDREKDRERERDKERDKDKDRKERKDKERSKPEESTKDKEREKSSRDRKEREDKDKDSSRRARDSSSKKEPERESQKSATASKREERSSKSVRRGSNDDDLNKTSTQKLDLDSAANKRIDNNSEGENHSENDANAARKRPSSAKGPRSLIEREENNNLQASQKLQVDSEDRGVRPTTARPGAPRPRLKNEPEEPIQSKINTSSKAKSTLIVNSDSDDDFVVKEQKIQEDEKKKNFKDLNDEEDFNKMGTMKSDQNNQEHGALVKKILESKEQLEYGSELNRQKDFKPLVQNDLQRKKDRERIQKEIEKLKESIQTLTKASIPLGRTLEFLQEDIDMMQKELVKWTEEYDLNVKAYKRQQAEAQSLLDPFKNTLNDIENQINDQSEKISSVKRKIIINEEKISKLLFNVGKRN